MDVHPSAGEAIVNADPTDVESSIDLVLDDCAKSDPYELFVTSHYDSLSQGGHGTTTPLPSAQACHDLWMTWPPVTQRMAFHGGVWARGRFTVTLAEAQEYARLLPLAMNSEHRRLGDGGFPQKLTLPVVRQLAMDVAQSCEVRTATRACLTSDTATVCDAGFHVEMLDTIDQAPLEMQCESQVSAATAFPEYCDSNSIEHAGNIVQSEFTQHRPRKDFSDHHEQDHAFHNDSALSVGCAHYLDYGCAGWIFQDGLYIPLSEAEFDLQQQRYDESQSASLAGASDTTVEPAADLNSSHSVIRRRRRVRLARYVDEKPTPTCSISISPCSLRSVSNHSAVDLRSSCSPSYHGPAEGSSSNCFRDRMKRKHSNSVSRSSRRSPSDEVDNCRIGVRLRSVSRCRRQSRSASKKWQRCSNRVRLIPGCGRKVH